MVARRRSFLFPIDLHHYVSEVGDGRVELGFLQTKTEQGETEREREKAIVVYHNKQSENIEYIVRTCHHVMGSKAVVNWAGL